MGDALRTRASKRLAKIELMEGKEAGKKAKSWVRVGTNSGYAPNWEINEETMLLTPHERAK